MNEKEFESLTTKKWIKYSLIIIVIMFVIAIIINYLILCPRQFEFVGKDTDWLSFWPTYLSSIASFAMVLITWWTLTKTQQHWEEEERPLLYAEVNQFIHSTQGNQRNDYKYVLKIENVGIQLASDVNVEVMFVSEDENIRTNIFYDKIVAEFNEIKKNVYMIKGKDTRLITLLPDSEWLPTNQNEDFKAYDSFHQFFMENSIKVIINYNQKYKLETKLTIKDATFLQTNIIQMLDYIRMSIGELKDVIKEQKKTTN